MRARTALAALDQAIEKSLWSYLFRGKKTKARYIKPRPKPAGEGEKAEPVGRLARRIGRNGLPISESRPFRNSWRGASRDLYGAAKGIYKTRRRTMSMRDALDRLEVAIEKAKASRTAAAKQTQSNLAFGRKLHAEGKTKRNEALRLKAIAAGKKLLGRKIYL